MGGRSPEVREKVVPIPIHCGLELLVLQLEGHQSGTHINISQVHILLSGIWRHTQGKVINVCSSFLQKKELKEEEQTVSAKLPSGLSEKETRIDASPSP